MKGETGKLITEMQSAHTKEPNGLSNEELDVMHHDNNIDLIAPMLATDIAKTVKL